jgi:hypothetical protein
MQISQDYFSLKIGRSATFSLHSYSSDRHLHNAIATQTCKRDTLRNAIAALRVQRETWSFAIVPQRFKPDTLRIAIVPSTIKRHVPRYNVESFC